MKIHIHYLIKIEKKCNVWFGVFCLEIQIKTYFTKKNYFHSLNLKTSEVFTKYININVYGLIKKQHKFGKSELVVASRALLAYFLTNLGFSKCSIHFRFLPQRAQKWIHFVWQNSKWQKISKWKCKLCNYLIWYFILPFGYPLDSMKNTSFFARGSAFSMLWTRGRLKTDSNATMA